jgi:excisionase family DNA binding protein
MTVQEIMETLARPTCEVKEAQEILDLSKNSMYAAVRKGEIESIRVGGRIRIITAPLRRRLGLEGSASAPDRRAGVA